MNTVNLSTLIAVKSALSEPAAPPADAQRVLAKLDGRDWIIPLDVELLLGELDPRLNALRPSLHNLIEGLGYRFEGIGRRPEAESSSPLVIPMLSVTSFAGLLCDLERLGFAVDPEPLVDRLLPEIMRKNLINEAETLVFWHRSARHRTQSGLTVLLKNDVPTRAWPAFDKHLLANGYTMSTVFDPNMKSIDLVVEAPHYVPVRYAA